MQPTNKKGGGGTGERDKPGPSSKSKGSKAKPKKEDKKDNELKHEKERKRRSSLGDSPITSSSACSTGDSADDCEGKKEGNGQDIAALGNDGGKKKIVNECHESTKFFAFNASKGRSEQTSSAQGLLREGVEMSVLSLSNYASFKDPSVRTAQDPSGFFANTGGAMYTTSACSGRDEESAAEVINHVEFDNINKIFSDQRNHLNFFKSKWIRALHQTVWDGNFERFHRRVRIIMVTLARKSIQDGQQISVPELLSNTMKGIIGHFHNEKEQTSILMTLLCSADPAKRCSDKMDHGYCRIAHSILGSISPLDRAKLLAVVTTRCGKTALHLAALSGSPCQLKVLLDSCAFPDSHDKSGRTALHYAIERNEREMVNQLIWYGADISLSQKDRFQHSPRRLAVDNVNSTIGEWFNRRMDAMNGRFFAWVKSMCGHLLHIQQEITAIHTARVFYAQEIGERQVRRECKLDIRGGFSDHLKQNRTRAILFIVPAYFHPNDVAAPADSPRIERTVFEGGSMVGRPRLSGLGHSETLLESVLEPANNSQVYAYALPADIVEGPYNLVFNFNAAHAFTESSQQPIVLLKAAVCSAVDSSKSKLD